MPQPKRQISFDVSREDFETISKIADRARGLSWPASMRPARQELLMDLTACHANGCPLRLDALLTAEPFDFAHDVGGIRRHLDRTTGELTDCFVPRYAVPESAAQARGRA